MQVVFLGGGVKVRKCLLIDELNTFLLELNGVENHKHGCLPVNRGTYLKCTAYL